MHNNLLLKSYLFFFFGFQISGQESGAFGGSLSFLIRITIAVPPRIHPKVNRPVCAIPELAIFTFPNKDMDFATK